MPSVKEYDVQRVLLMLRVACHALCRAVTLEAHMKSLDGV